MEKSKFKRAGIKMWHAQKNMWAILTGYGRLSTKKSSKPIFFQPKNHPLCRTRFLPPYLLTFKLSHFSTFPRSRFHTFSHHSVAESFFLTSNTFSPNPPLINDVQVLCCLKLWGNPVEIRDGPAAVSGDESRKKPLSCKPIIGLRPADQKTSDARRPKFFGKRRTDWYAAMTKNEDNAADEVFSSARWWEGAAIRLIRESEDLPG